MTMHALVVAAVNREVGASFNTHALLVVISAGANSQRRQWIELSSLGELIVWWSAR